MHLMPDAVPVTPRCGPNTLPVDPCTGPKRN
jgi:hypothetical protein